LFYSYMDNVLDMKKMYDQFKTESKTDQMPSSTLLHLF